MDEKVTEAIADVSKEIVKPVYEDLGPAIKPTVGLISLPIRAVKAMLLPFEKWIISREQNLDDFINQKVPEKLKGVDENKISQPSAYLAVPILQAASSCNSKELSDLYAELLAKSMYDDTKESVHPSFVKIIEQICPDEAKILKYFFHNRPTETSNTESVMFLAEIILNEQPHLVRFSDLTVNSGCEKIGDTLMYIKNLTRLGLIEVYKAPRNHIYSIKNAELKKVVETTLTLVVASKISNATLSFEEAAKVLNEEKNMFNYQCYYDGSLITTSYYDRFANAAISPIQKDADSK